MASTPDDWDDSYLPHDRSTNPDEDFSFLDKVELAIEGALILYLLVTQRKAQKILDAYHAQLRNEIEKTMTVARKQD